MRSSRAESDGSRRMTSAICELRLHSDFTSALKARLMLCSEASFGQPSMRRLISSSEKGVARAGGGKVVSVSIAWRRGGTCRRSDRRAGVQGK